MTASWTAFCPTFVSITALLGELMLYQPCTLLKNCTVSILFLLKVFIFPTYKILRGCLHDTGATFAPRRVHSGPLSWLYICLHDTTTKSHAGASHPGVSSLRLSHQGENFTPVRNLATVSCKHETTTRFGVKSV